MIQLPKLLNTLLVYPVYSNRGNWCICWGHFSCGLMDIDALVNIYSRMQTDPKRRGKTNPTVSVHGKVSASQESYNRKTTSLV